MEGNLEVDARTNLPIPYQRHGDGEGDKYTNGMPPVSPDQENHATQRPLQVQRFFGLRPPTFFLSIALALALMLAVITAGIAGWMASQRDTGCVEI